MNIISRRPPYGYFDDSTREYVIIRPDTPTPWINYIGQEDYFGIVSNTGGGYSFYKDPRYRRLTRYKYHSIPVDQPGRYIYMRDSETNEYWGATWQPVKKPLDFYECRHGIGYTKIKTSYKGIETEVTYFVPLRQTFEVWWLKVRNLRDREADVQLFTYVEFCFWDALDDMTNFQRNLNIAEVEIEDNVIYHKTGYRERRNHFAFFASSEPIVGFDTDKEVFIGLYRSLENPIVVEEGVSRNSIVYGGHPIGSHQIRLKLKPKEEKEIILILGYSENSPEEKFIAPNIVNKIKVKQLLREYLNPARVREAFEELKRFWNEILSYLQVETPDEDINRIVNIWNQYQIYITFYLSRSASGYESGISRGVGFRDSNQDILGAVHLIPLWSRIKERIIDLASIQFPDGSTYHQFQPITKRGNKEIGGGFNDDPLWLVASTTAYIRETGDFSILFEKAPYDNTPGTEESLYEHLKKAIQYIVNNVGPHKLPLIGHADWNDCLNLNVMSINPDESFQATPDRTDGKTAESVFIACQFVWTVKEFANIAERAGFKEDAEYFRKLVKEMIERVLKYGWDGEWFLRAYDAFGHKIGSRENEEGKIYIEPQGMCVMAQIGLEDEKAVKALDSVKKYLATEHGIILHWPPYTKYHIHLGEISSYPPGHKENASIFCHPNTWIIIAETIIGRCEQAIDYYKKINPSFRETISHIHRTEPYVYAQTIAGPASPRFGSARNSWLTGTASWSFVAITQWILGIRPVYDGLLIDPCIPRHWSGFKMIRKFRGATYVIEVKNEEHIGKGVKQIIVDGKPIEGNIVPDFRDGKTHHVLVIMGRKES